MNEIEYVKCIARDISEKIKAAKKKHIKKTLIDEANQKKIKKEWNGDFDGDTLSIYAVKKK